MDAFSLLRRLYTADVLDTRFVPDSHDPLPLSASVFAETSTLPRKAGEPPKKPLPAGAQVSKWRTPEFKVYYAVFIYVVPSMLKQAYDISQGRLWGLDGWRERDGWGCSS